MTETIQTRKIKCPHCGYVRSWRFRSEGAEGPLVDIVLGDGGRISFENLLTRIKQMWSDPELEAANAWVDMPECPKCEQIYQYNLRTGETR